MATNQDNPASAAHDMLALRGEGTSHDVVARALRAVRSHLGLQVAYVSQIVGTESVFRTVDAPGLEHLIKPGDVKSLDHVYCRHILEGRLPELIPDTAAEPVAMAMPITAAVPIGAHVSVPLRLSDGSVYGMFCCLGPAANPTLNERDLAMMRAFADLTAFEIEREIDDVAETAAQRARIERVLADDSLGIVYQPIWSLSRNGPAGFEALSRFDAEPRRSPELWFAEAAAVGFGVELELLAIRRAVAALDVLPGDTYLSVNASAETLMSGRLQPLLAGLPLDRLVLEITEHEGIEDFSGFEREVAMLRAQGMRLAADDAGAGYSGLQQILQMRPDLIKLDRFLIQGIQHDPSRRALAGALGMFAMETGARVVAEGVETEGELAMLRAIGIDLVQGYLLGRPAPLGETIGVVLRAVG